MLFAYFNVLNYVKTRRDSNTRMILLQYLKTRTEQRWRRIKHAHNVSKVKVYGWNTRKKHDDESNKKKKIQGENKKQCRSEVRKNKYKNTKI